MARAKTTKEETQENTVPPAVFGTPVNDLDAPAPDEGEELPREEDIFDDYAARLVKEGDAVTFTIFRNGECVAPKIGFPYSWDKVYKKWGGGTFKVLVRSSKAGHYVKGQSQTFASTDEFEEEEDAPAEKSSSTADLMLLMDRMRQTERAEAQAREEREETRRREQAERERQEAERREKEMKESTNTTMMLMMQMMKSQSEQTTALLTALVGGKKEDVSVEKIVTMMDARMEKMIDRITGTKDRKEIDALKLIEIQEKARESGYKQAMDAHKLAEQKAEELAERRGSGGDAPGPSTTEKLIESVMPMAQMFMAARAGGTPAAAPAPSNPAVNPHKPALPAPPGPLPLGGVPRVMAGIPGVPGRPAPAAVKQPAQKETPVKDPKRTTIETVVIDEIGKDLSANLLTQKFDPEKTADKVLEVLKSSEITPEYLCSAYTLDDMMKVARAKGIPDAIKPYLERFYAHIKAKTSVGLGDAPQSNQPGSR